MKIIHKKIQFVFQDFHLHNQIDSEMIKKILSESPNFIIEVIGVMKRKLVNFSIQI